MFQSRFVLPILYTAVLVAVAVLSHFAVLSNDAFPLRWQAEHLSIHDPNTFYNGFFPMGYPLLDRLVAFTRNPVLTMMLVQIALAPAYIWFAQKLLEKVVGHDSAIAALPLVLFEPQVISNILSATPDFLAALFVLLGFWFLVRANTPGTFLSAGIALGFGYLFRVHVIILVGSLAIACLLFQKANRFRLCGLLLLGTVPFVLAQGFLQLWSGHGFFENSQAFTIWRTIYGSNWNNLPELSGASALDVIRSNPARFFFAVWSQIVSESLYFIPMLIAAIVLVVHRRYRTQRPFAILLFATLLYLVVSTSGGSPRNIIITVPVVAAAVLFAVGIVKKRFPEPSKRRAALVVGLLLWIAGITGTLMHSLRAAHRVRHYQEIERLLHVQTGSDAARIFTDDFDLYFPDLRYITPRTSGGWPELGLPSYAARFPHIPDSNAPMLHANLVREGIHWAIFRNPPYDERGYDSVSGDSSLFRLMYKTPRHNIYRVE